MHKRGKPNPRGFTLTEMMLVVAVVAIILSTVAPKLGSYMTRAKESGILGNLGALRSAMSLYYSDMQGQYPSNFTALRPKYLRAFPVVTVPNPSGGAYHKNAGLTWTGGTAEICDASSGDIWYLFNSGSAAGLVFINCTHRDSKGRIWSTY